AGQRQQHDRHQRMAPGGDEPPDAPHADQIDQPDHTGKPAAHRPDTRQPDPGTTPERIRRQQIAAIGADQRQQSRDRKMNQHRMQWMAAQGHAAGHRAMRRVRCGHGGRLPAWTIPAQSAPGLPATGRGRAAFDVFFRLLPLLWLAGCDGPQSALQPAGDAARAAAALWWGMFAVSVAVITGVTLLWLYALRARRDTPDIVQQQRLQRRLLIGGGLVLPVLAVT